LDVLMAMKFWVAEEVGQSVVNTWSMLSMNEDIVL
jgi:hypothetical protein